MSLQTTIARGAARAAEAEWDRHRRTCLRCGSRVRPILRCDDGEALRTDALELRAEARESARLDKGPGPNDVPLFDLGGQPCG